MLSRHPQESFPIKCLELFIAGVLTVIDIKIQGLTLVTLSFSFPSRFIPVLSLTPVISLFQLVGHNASQDYK
jgi:hypothetical protein